MTATDQDGLILYSHPWAQNPLKVRFLLRTLRLDVDLREVPLDEDRPEWYAEINPYRRLPTLIDGAVVLAESNAILRYLAAREGREDLYPSGLAERGRIDWALDGWSTQIRPTLSGLEAAAIWHSQLEEGGGAWTDGDQQEIARALPRATSGLTLLESVISDNGTFTGDISIADYSVAPVLCRTFRLPLDFAPWPRLSLMRDTLASHPDFQAVAPPGWSKAPVQT